MGTGICFLDPGGVNPAAPALVRRELLHFGRQRLGADRRNDAHARPRPFRIDPHRAPARVAQHQRRTRRAGSRCKRRSRDRSSTGRDTFFTTNAPAPDADVPIGHFDESQLPRPGGASQMEGFNPTTGVAIKMFVDRSFGATHQSLFLIQYSPGAKIDPHDHTFEESLLHCRRARSRRRGRQELRPRSRRRHLDRRRLHS